MANIYCLPVMNKSKIIFLDVDGTLISFDTHRVPESAIAALRKAHDQGIKIVIATGRAWTDLADLDDIPYDAIVSLNGAHNLLRDGTDISLKPIPRKDFDVVRDMARRHDFPIAIEVENGLFVNKVTDIVVKLSNLTAHPVPPVVDLEKVFSRGRCCQICLYCEENVEKEIMAELPGLTVSRWNPYFADVNVAGVDKGTGISEICRYYGIDPKDSMAIGDGGNDIPMFRTAGISVAMGGASDNVKSAAGFVTDTVDNHGIANAMQYFGIA